LYAARKALGARSVDGALAQLRTRPDQETCQEFLEQARTESGLEYFFWLQLLASGALPCRLSLYKAGFRALRVVEAGSRKGLGDSRAACLDVQTGRCRCLLFPQVTLDTRKAYFRLDALACVRARRDRCWLNLEIDGEGHDGQFDQERQLLLGLPTIRLSASEVASPNLLSLLDGKLAHVVGLPRAS